MTERVFIHGLESSNRGTKSIFFREKFPDMIIPTFTGDLQERMKTLHTVLSGKSNLRIVGSSFGGLMASLFAMQNQTDVEKMVLLAPALNLMEFAPQETRKIHIPVWVYHGKDDEVIPLLQVERIARDTFLDLSFHVVEDDHYLHKTFKNIDWGSLLA
jgi:pimeloyl-ACP methyl ester carboxylesterase